MGDTKSPNQLEELVLSVRAAADGVQRAAVAMQAAAEDQKRVTEAYIRLRDVCRAAAEALRIRTPEERAREAELKAFLDEMVATAKRAHWHITTVMAQCIRKPFCRRKARLVRSMDQAERANEQLRGYLRDIGARFPEQTAKADEVCTIIAWTDAGIAEVRRTLPWLPFMRTAQDGPEEIERP